MGGRIKFRSQSQPEAKMSQTKLSQVMHKSTPEIPQANSMSPFESHPSKLTPKQLQVSRHTTDTLTPAAIQTVGVLSILLTCQPALPVLRGAPSTRALCRKSRHNTSNWEAPREAAFNRITQTLPPFSWSGLALAVSTLLVSSYLNMMSARAWVALAHRV